MTSPYKDAAVINTTGGDFYTIAEAMMELGLVGKNAERTLYRWRKAGHIRDLETGPGGQVRLDRLSVDKVAAVSKRPLPGNIDLTNDVVWVSRGQLLATIATAEKMGYLMVAFEGALRREEVIAAVTVELESARATCKQLATDLSREKSKTAALEDAVKSYEAKMKPGFFTTILRRWL